MSRTVWDMWWRNGQNKHKHTSKYTFTETNKSKYTHGHKYVHTQITLKYPQNKTVLWEVVFIRCWRILDDTEIHTFDICRSKTVWVPFSFRQTPEIKCVELAFPSANPNL